MRPNPNENPNPNQDNKMNTNTPLRAAAADFVRQAGYTGYDVKLKESISAHKSGSSAYDVFVREPGAKRGRCIGSMLLKVIYA